MNKKIEILVLTVVCFILAIAIAIQINTVNKNGTTVYLSQQESNLKSQVLRMKEKYEEQYNELEKVEKELTKAREQVTKNNEELEEIESKIKQDNILLGNTDVKGTGIKVTLKDGKKELNVLDEEKLIVHDVNVLAVINELRNAGAEAISINGKRVVNSTAIMCDGNVIIVNGEKIGSPVEISAIGLTVMLSGLDRAGGTLDKFAEDGKEVELKKINNLEIPKYTGKLSFKYAESIK